MPKRQSRAKRPSTRRGQSAPPRGVSAAEAGVLAESLGAKTVIYVHGIGNKPEASTLKCQWDTALFGVPLGDRTRMAYWVNRAFYPRPLPGDCRSGDLVPSTNSDEENVKLASANGTDPIEEEAARLTGKDSERRLLSRLGHRMESAAQNMAPGTVVQTGVGARVLPLPAFMRRFITRHLTKTFLRDVHEFLFVKERREAMIRSVTERIDAGGGPFVVVAHSQGTMIAYEALRRMQKGSVKIPLFVTIGSPLGMAEVQDEIRKWGKKKVMDIPAVVDRWINIAERLDPVAIDGAISSDFTPKGFIKDHVQTGLNPDSPRHPHSATGYLSTEWVKKPVMECVGSGFPQEVGAFVIARDLANSLENSESEDRAEVLIEIAEEKLTGLDRSLEEAKKKVIGELRTLIGKDAVKVASIDPLRHFVAARLTRWEVEKLRTDHEELVISHVWRNAQKHALVEKSTQTVQALPANRAYAATGREIHWAIVDSGINAAHPHFQTHSNVVAHWNCLETGDPVAIPQKDANSDGNGHGTHVAGIIAGKADAKRLDRKTRERVDVAMSGMAPETKLHIYRTLNDEGFGRDSSVIKALDHIFQVNEDAGYPVIHGINLSLGGSFDPSVYGCGHSPLCRELRRLWRQGVVVVIAAGNDGYAILQTARGAIEANLDLSIGDPANLEEAIAVGSVHKENPNTYGISFFSSRGPTADGRQKPDVVAPGEKILSACSRYGPRAVAEKKFEELYVQMSGTSMAAPHVSGILAAFLSIRREYIGFPDRVKNILLKSCNDLGRDPYIQGRGLVNLVKMLALN